MTDYNRGLLAGQEAMKRTLEEEVSKLKSDYLNENEKLTNLLLDAELEIKRLQSIAQQAHDRLLRGDDDNELLSILEAAWKQRPNADVTGLAPGKDEK